LNVEQDPRLVGVVRYRCQQQVMGNAVEEVLSVALNEDVRVVAAAGVGDG
jgi:hypothetical protein